MSPDDIARFLRTHPQFFDEHPELLESIYVPHPHGGRTIALTEPRVRIRSRADEQRLDCS